MTSAVKTNAIVSSLFPIQVRDRLLEDANKREEKLLGNNVIDLLETKKTDLLKTRPIADLVSLPYQSRIENFAHFSSP